MKTIMLKKSKLPPFVQEALDAIVYDLERHGRTTTSNGKASRYLSYRMRQYKKNNQIIIKWIPELKGSVVMLKPGVSLTRVSENKVRLEIENNK